MTSQLFRCNAATTLTSCRILASELASRVADRKREQIEGKIDATQYFTTCAAAAAAKKKEPVSVDVSEFRKRIKTNENLCILPPGIDAIEISSIRWKERKQDEEAEVEKQQVEEAKPIQQLCTESSPVTLLLPSSSSNEKNNNLEINSGPLLVEGLDRLAELVFETPLQEEKEEAEKESIGVGIYDVISKQEREQQTSSALSKKQSSIFGSFGPKTLFSSPRIGEGSGRLPVLVHACPCPLQFDRYCQLAVGKPPKQHQIPNTPTTSATEQKEEEKKEKEMKIPISRFTRKLAAATVVICRVKKLNPEAGALPWDYFVLLTQRPEHMRTFPLYFVVPGGGCEAGELLENTARRELIEEVALQLVDSEEEVENCKKEAQEEKKKKQKENQNEGEEDDGFSQASTEVAIEGGEWRFQGIWESSHPTCSRQEPVVSGEATVRSHIVFFFSVMIEAKDVASLPRLRPQQEEVANAFWYRYGPDVMKVCQEEKLEFKQNPEVSAYFREEDLDNNLLRLTLQRVEPKHQEKEKEEEMNKSKNKFNTTPMKITAGTEFFIQRALELDIAEEIAKAKRREQEEK